MTEDDGSPFDAELMAAVADLGAALRGVVDTSVSTIVAADERRAAAAEVRAVTERLPSPGARPPSCPRSTTRCRSGASTTL